MTDVKEWEAPGEILRLLEEQKIRETHLWDQKAMRGSEIQEVALATERSVNRDLRLTLKILENEVEKYSSECTILKKVERDLSLRLEAYTEEISKLGLLVDELRLNLVETESANEAASSHIEKLKGIIHKSEIANSNLQSEFEEYKKNSKDAIHKLESELSLSRSRHVTSLKENQKVREESQENSYLYREAERKRETFCKRSGAFFLFNSVRKLYTAKMMKAFHCWQYFNINKKAMKEHNKIINDELKNFELLNLQVLERHQHEQQNLEAKCKKQQQGLIKLVERIRMSQSSLFGRTISPLRKSFNVMRAKYILSLCSRNENLKEEISIIENENIRVLQSVDELDSQVGTLKSRLLYNILAMLQRRKIQSTFHAWLLFTNKSIQRDFVVSKRGFDLTAVEHTTLLRDLTIDNRVMKTRLHNLYEEKVDACETVAKLTSRNEVYPAKLADAILAVTTRQNVLSRTFYTLRIIYLTSLFERIRAPGSAESLKVSPRSSSKTGTPKGHFKNSLRINTSPQYGNSSFNSDKFETSSVVSSRSNISVTPRRSSLKQSPDSGSSQSNMKSVKYKIDDSSPSVQTKASIISKSTTPTRNEATLSVSSFVRRTAAEMKKTSSSTA